MAMELTLREKPRAVLKQLRYLDTIGKIAIKLGWDRLRVLLILDELSKARLVEKTDTESYKLTDQGEKALERIEAQERLAELSKIEPWKKFKWSWEIKGWELK